MRGIRTIDFTAAPARAIIGKREEGAMDANEYLLEAMLGHGLIRPGRALIDHPARRPRHA
jgi:hypothetical protein